MSGVYIVGAGIHPFGRTPERTGLLQGVFAVRQALGRAGLDWRDIQFAYGGSDAAGKADTMVSELGLTGLPFINVANGCATGGSAMFGAYSTIKSGSTSVSRWVSTSIRAARSIPSPPNGACRIGTAKPASC